MIQTIVIRHPGHSDQFICIKQLNLAIIMLKYCPVSVPNGRDRDNILGKIWYEQHGSCSDRFPVSLNDTIAPSLSIDEMGRAPSIHFQWWIKLPECPWHEVPIVECHWRCCSRILDPRIVHFLTSSGNLYISPGLGVQRVLLFVIFGYLIFMVLGYLIFMGFINFILFIGNWCVFIVRDIRAFEGRPLVGRSKSSRQQVIHF